MSKKIIQKLLHTSRRTALLLLTLLLLVTNVVSPTQSLTRTVYAGDECDLFAFEKGSTLADSEKCAECSVPGTTPDSAEPSDTDDPVQESYTYLTSDKNPPKFLPVQAAAIIGNAMIESGDGIDPNAKNGSSYQGIAQWDTKIRWPKFVKWAESNGKKTDDRKAQLEYIFVEFSTDPYFASPYADFKKITDPNAVASATKLVLDRYEGAPGQKEGERIEKAKGVLAKYASGTGQSTASSSLKELADQMLAKPENIKYWTNNGVNTKSVVEAISNGKKAYTTAGNAPNKEADLNPNILRFILEVANTKKPDRSGNYTIMVNALTDKTHSGPGSNHYKGLAVDLDANVGNTSAPVSVLNSIAEKYGGKKNSETSHHHYDFTGSGSTTPVTPEEAPVAAACCPVPGAGGPVSAVASQGIYNSGLSGPYIVEQFITHVLKAIAQKTNKPEADVATQEHIIALIAFAGAEGGGVKGNQGTYNLFNTKLKDADLQGTAYTTDNGKDDETMNYPSFDKGIEATARTMVSNKYQTRLITALTDKNVTADGFMEILTYYNRYPGNLAWAAASDPKQGGDPVKYLATQKSLVQSVRSDYKSRAGIPLDGWNGGGTTPTPTGSGGTAPASGGTANCAETVQTPTEGDTDTTNIQCAIGAPNLGEETGYKDGNPYKIRLCAIPGIKSVDGTMQAKVNSVVSQKFLDLAAAASGANPKINLVFNGADSTFRSMKRQKELCYTDERTGKYTEGVENTSCSKGFTAKPGHSNHQMGMAIDFNFDGYSTGSDKMNGRCKTAKQNNKRCELPESKSWVWMKNNAQAKAGITQLEYEYWHWGTNEK